ncbi:C39 family peptidase [Paenibacillus sp. NPDC058177]|uniref:C39 family peptidase n=1 Tax=Paenibacillus sp. NPDC058177 TaxID=3346369 RepID=UPI0036DEE945
MKSYLMKSFLLVVFLILVIPSISEASSVEPVGSTKVSREEADKVAVQFLEKHQFSEPFTALISVEPAYDVNEELIAYYYIFSDQYVLVAANKSYSPVLAAGEGSLDIAELNKEGKLYYLGGIEAVSALNAEEVMEKNHQSDQKTFANSNTGLVKNPDADSLWDAYLNGSSFSIGIKALTEKKITITTFDQYETGVNHSASACGPTTMAAISEYWRQYRGFNLLPSTIYYGSKAATINHFYSEHGGFIGGMSVAGVKIGLEMHNGDFYRSASASVISGYNAYRNEINANRPVAVKFDKKFTFFEPDWDYAYTYHWTVGKGYAYDSFDSMIIVNDNTGTKQEHYIDFPTNQPILSMVAYSM